LTKLQNFICGNFFETQYVHITSDVTSSAKCLQVKWAAEAREGWGAINRKAMS